MPKEFLSFFQIQDNQGREYLCHMFEQRSLVEKINERYPAEATRYAVNIGCGDGKSMNDPVYPFYTNGFNGLAIEGGENKELFVNLPEPGIRKLDSTFVTPYNAVGLLRENGCPTACDFLKLDIDGYDGIVLKTLLEGGFRPKVLQVEINPEIPPPISFAVLYDDQYRSVDKEGKVGGFYSLSLGYATSLVEQYGYQLIHLDFITPWTHDALFVHRKYLSIFSDQERSLFADPPAVMFLRHPPGYSHFMEYGIHSLPWRFEKDPHKLAKMVWLACTLANLRKHNGYGVPFHFTY